MEAAAKAFLSEHKDWKRARPRRARRGANGLRYSLGHGYMRDGRWSVNAEEAMSEGRFPAKHIAWQLGISPEVVENTLPWEGEFHHMGEDFKKVHFYSMPNAAERIMLKYFVPRIRNKKDGGTLSFDNHRDKVARQFGVYDYVGIAKMRMSAEEEAALDLEAFEKAYAEAAEKDRAERDAEMREMSEKYGVEMEEIPQPLDYDYEYDFHDDEGEIRYSLSAAEQAAWDGVLDAYEAGTLPQRVFHKVLNRTPVVLQRLGLKNRPITIRKETIDKIIGKNPNKTGDYHNVPIPALRELLRELDNPVAVFESVSPHAKKAIVVLTELTDEANGEKAIVPVEIDEQTGAIKSHRITSAYGRPTKDISKWIASKKILYANTKKLPNLLTADAGAIPATLPEGANKLGSEILTEKDFTQDELGVVKVNNKILRNSAGLVYGYWDEGSGELHLNEDFADFDTPLHEWAHVWLSWVRKADARLAERALAVTKETRFYKRLREDKGSAYAGLSDDALAEEAFAMLCGKDGGVPVLRVSSVAFDFAENFLQAANRGEGIVVPADGAHDGKVPRAGAEHGGQPRFVEPADGDGGTRRGVDHRAHGLQAQRRIGNFLGRRGVDGADADVVGSGGTRGSRLRERMRGEPENFQRREAFPCGGQRHVVLPEMHAVGLRFRGDFRIVVHDEERARSRSDAANVFRGFDDAFPRRALHAQLNETQACAHGCVRAGFITRRGIRDDEVKAEGIFHEEKKKKTRERGDCARHPMAFPSSFFSASNLRR